MSVNTPNPNAPIAVVLVDPTTGLPTTPFTPAGTWLAYTAPTATVNNAAPANFGNLVGRLDVTLGAGAQTTLTGLQAGVDGQPLTIRNVDTTNTLILSNRNGASLAANQFSSSGDTNLPPGGSVTLTYYAQTVNKWVVT